MIAGEPEFSEILKARVFRDLLWRQMTVVVDDRLGLSIIVVQRLRPFRPQQEIARDENIMH